MTSPVNIVVFTGNPSYSVRKGIVEIDRSLPGLSWMILIHSPRKTPRRLIKSQWLNLRRNGWRWIPYQTADIWRRIFDRAASEHRSSRVPGDEFGIDALEAMHNVKVVRTSDIHGEQSLASVIAFAPDLGLSIAAPILRLPLFSIPRLGTINLHKGKVPDYRGMPAAFWELWNDEPSVGCTVHWVDEKLDTGAVVHQATVARTKFSTVRGLQLQLDEVGVVLMRDAALDILRGTSSALPQPSGGRSYRKPTLAQVGTLERRLLRMQVPGHSGPRRLLKKGLRSAGFGLWRTGLVRALSPRITVILYHRVTDEVRDNLTIGIEQFDRQMALLSEHCQLMSIEEVMSTDVVPRTERPLVAVTFDDGYLDNYENAVPILARHGIPAAFFVSTGIVDSDGRFPHDVERANPPIPVMNWGQLREMRDRGFTIGSHTVNHIDCAAEPEERVRAELAQSRDDLKRELGITAPLFGYPYGGMRHMTPQRLELVRQAGYAGCLSAYGGTNVGAVDRFNVLRRGVHWEFSDDAFLFECLGLR